MARARPKKAPARRFVLDCSIVLAWYFADEANDYADAVAGALASAVVIVPSLFLLELANTLVVGERRGRSTAAQATAFLTRLAALPIVVDEQTMKRAWLDTISLARSHGLSTYDAAYLELALREALPLATLDDRLAAASKALGVVSFEP
jgi:predicted nucleic acid-binding protein